MRFVEGVIGAAFLCSSCHPASAAAPAAASSDPKEARATVSNRAPVAGDRAVAQWNGGWTEVGIIAGAPYRIDVPGNWNGGLMLYCHGYGGAPTPFVATDPSLTAEPFLAEGYAVAQSAFSAGGYAVEEGARDTEALRGYFASRVGNPRETWISGQSLGGEILTMLLEQHPASYEGGLSMCSALGPALSYVKTIVFDPLVLFEYWFPGMLPSPASVPADYTMSWDRAARLARALTEKPEAANALRARGVVRTNDELSRNLDLFTYIMAELEQRYGGNPFDNRETIYSGLGDDEAVNDGVQRYTADPNAERAILRIYTPTGRLERPLLSLRNVCDPIISAYSSDRYSELVRIAGRGRFFAQQYVKGAGHCEITPNEVRAAFDALRKWRKTGVRPAPGALKEPVLTRGALPARLEPAHRRRLEVEPIRGDIAELVTWPD
jgi:pimeloyl-ACP methyl ester carboxylesterase